MDNKPALLKKYWLILIAVLFALAIALGLIQRDNNQYTANNQGGKIQLSEEAQSELWRFYRTAQELSGRRDPPQPKLTTTFLAVGDIMLSRNVAAAIKQVHDPLLPFSKMTEVFNSVNFAFGNLESPFAAPKGNSSESSPETSTTDDGGGIVGGHSLIFSAPRDNIQGLVKNKFKILNLANNHALDQGAKGLEYTIKYLEKNGIKHIGASGCQTKTDSTVDDRLEGNAGSGDTSEQLFKSNPDYTIPQNFPPAESNCFNEAWQPAMIEANGIKICFLGTSYASVNDGGKAINNHVARIEDRDKLKTSIAYSESVCDFTVVSMHAGIEYTHKPNQAQIDFARAAIDYGADMVIGHHPHWIQEIEKYCPAPPAASQSEKMPVGQAESGCSNPKYIFYSLGNFIFDQMWSRETREGLAIKVTITAVGAGHDLSLQGPRSPAQLESIELLPIIIDNYSTPRLAGEAESKKILEKINIVNTILK